MLTAIKSSTQIHPSSPEKTNVAIFFFKITELIYTRIISENLSINVKEILKEFGARTLIFSFMIRTSSCHLKSYIIINGKVNCQLEH